MTLISNSLKKGFLLLSMILTFNIAYAQDIYWVGGSGAWDNLNQWSKVPGNQPYVPAGTIPKANHTVRIDEHSGLLNTSNILIRPGDYEVNDIIVTTSASFDLRLFGIGSGADRVTMTVFGDLTLTSTMDITYGSTGITNNTWIFDGPNTHDIDTGNKDLLNVEFLDESGTFNQLSNFKATEQI